MAATGSASALKHRGYEQPLFYWDPSIRAVRARQLSGRHVPEWKGDLIAGSLKLPWSRGSTATKAAMILNEERMFEGEFGRIRDINVAPDGSIWLLTDESDGRDHQAKPGGLSFLKEKPAAAKRQVLS